MTLDLGAIAGQIQAMATSVDGAQDAARFDALRTAWNEHDTVELNRRLSSAKTTFLVPGTQANLTTREQLPAAPGEYAVVATDASFILPNRHHPARFWLLNIGTVVLHYGSEPQAELRSEPRLFHEEHDLFVPDDIHRLPVNGTFLGPRRAADELAAAIDTLALLDTPAVALQDGTLILWGLGSMPDAVTTWSLPKFLDALMRSRELGQPVASYISAPGSAELLNALRIAVCDYPARNLAVDCDHCRRRIASEGHVPACDILPPVSDRWLLDEIAKLRPGERTAPFRSQSRVLAQYEAMHPDLHIYYFYMHNGWEIGRVEVPRWVAENLDQLELVHWVLHDQSQLGLGYPLALQEAHEMAVLSMADRRLVEDAVERALADANVTVTYHGKAGSKRVRAI